MTWFGQEIFQLSETSGRSTTRPIQARRTRTASPGTRGRRRDDAESSTPSWRPPGRRPGRPIWSTVTTSSAARRPSRDRRVPAGHARWELVRAPGGDHLHGTGVERADPDQAGLWVRGGRTGEDPARVPVDAARSRSYPAALQRSLTRQEARVPVPSPLEAAPRPVSLGVLALQPSRGRPRAGRRHR